MQTSILKGSFANNTRKEKRLSKFSSEMRRNKFKYDEIGKYPSDICDGVRRKMAAITAPYPLPVPQAHKSRVTIRGSAISEKKIMGPSAIFMCVILREGGMAQNRTPFWMLAFPLDGSVLHQSGEVPILLVLRCKHRWVFSGNQSRKYPFVKCIYCFSKLLLLSVRAFF